MIVVEYLTMSWDLEMNKPKLENKRIAIRKVRHYLSLSLFKQQGLQRSIKCEIDVISSGC